MVIKELHTGRLTLRAITPEVYDYIYANMDDNSIIAFLGLASEEALQKEKKKYRQGLATHNRKFINFLMIDKQTHAIIGACGFHTWFPDHRRAEIGYSLYNDIHKRKGLMTEALNAVLKYGFETMNLHRVEALIGRENTASLKLVSNFNFKQEGVLREHYVVNGIPEDSLAFSLLVHEFKG